MLDFKTIRELYELCYAKNTLEIDQIEYVELEGSELTVTAERSVLSNSMTVLILRMPRSFIQRNLAIIKKWPRS